MTISASEIRARVARGEDIAGAGAAGGGGLHRAARALRLMDIRVKQRAVVEALEDVKGRDILVFNTARLPSMFERVVIASGDSNRQVKALADRVRSAERARRRASTGSKASRTASGCWSTSATWSCTSCIRRCASFYNLEEIWGGKPVQAQGRERPEEEARRRRSEAACQGSTSSR